MITAAQIKKVAPSAKPWIVDGIVANQNLMVEHGIDTVLRAQHFLAQCALETGGFTLLEENLSYSAKRMTEVWPSRFKSVGAAKPFERNPEALANKVYGGRLGNNSSGDGWKYRGSGMKQLTGKANHEQFKKATGIDVVGNPEILRKFPGAMESACVFWSKNNLSRFADKDDVVGLTKAINGGTTGLADRKAYLAKCKKFVTSAPGGRAEPPAVVPLPPAVDKATVRDVQERLLGHGYVQVGGTDGLVGDFTKSAIRDFRANNGLPEGDGIDVDLITALKRPDAVRPVIAPERSKATLSDLREKDSSIVKGTDLQKVGTAAAISGTAAAPVLKALSDTGEQVGQITEALTPFQSLMAFFADWLWVPVVIIVGVVGVYAIKIARARLRDHQLGNTSVVNLPAKTGDA